MLEGILIPFAAIALAELGDKTQLSVLLLSSKTKKHLQLLLGVITAFLIVDGIAIFAGSWITSIVPLAWIKIFSGAVFILFGLLTLRKSEQKAESKAYFKSAFLSGFAMIFVSEWGDKTQIASALFGAEYNPFLVLAGTLSALALLSAIAIYSGKFISERVDRKLMVKISGAAFIIIGISFFII